MNKSKKNLELLLRHMGRDTAGIALLEAVSRDLAEMRKRIASLEQSEASAVNLTKKHRVELDHAQIQITQLKEELQLEQAKRVAADNRANRQAERIAKMESDVEASDETPALDLGVDAKRFLALFTEVKRRYKRAPVFSGCEAGLLVDDLIPNYSGDEFMGLGMLVAFTASFSSRVVLISDRRIKDLKLPEDTLKRIVYFLGPWIKAVAWKEKIADSFLINLPATTK